MRDQERVAWLAERRSEVEREYTAEGPTYDDGYDPATIIHRRFVTRLLATVAPGGSVLDAACGTAPYAGMVVDAGLGFTGVDQSAGMLMTARSKWPDVRFERIGLQELTFEGAFDAVMCTDAMENVPPEQWPAVVGAFARALRPDGHLYLTVEEIDRAEQEAAFVHAGERGWPAVFGEVVVGDTAGYHFYPGREQVDSWVADGGFARVDEVDEPFDGYGYRHLLLRLIAKS